MAAEQDEHVRNKPFTLTARVPYQSSEEASMVKNALAVDPELRPECVYRMLTVEDTELVINFWAIDARTLRAAAKTFCDLLGLATSTLENFPRMEQEKPPLKNGE